MITKVFGGKKVTIRGATKADLKNAKKFQNFINSMIREEAKLLMNKKASLKDEVEFISAVLKGAGKKTKVYLIAECDNEIAGTVSIESQRYRRNHIGKFGIAIAKNYRSIGLGKYLTAEIIRLAKIKLSPKPQIIQLEVYVNNEPAIGLYKKMGFKIVGKIPKQIQWKGKLITEFIMIKCL